MANPVKDVIWNSSSEQARIFSSDEELSRILQESGFTILKEDGFDLLKEQQ